MFFRLQHTRFDYITCFTCFICPRFGHSSSPVSLNPHSPPSCLAVAAPSSHGLCLLKATMIIQPAHRQCGLVTRPLGAPRSTLLALGHRAAACLGTARCLDASCCSVALPNPCSMPIASLMKVLSVQATPPPPLLNAHCLLLHRSATVRPAHEAADLAQGSATCVTPTAAPALRHLPLLL